MEAQILTNHRGDLPTRTRRIIAELLRIFVQRLQVCLERKDGEVRRLSSARNIGAHEGCACPTGRPVVRGAGALGRLCRECDDCTKIVQRHCRLSSEECSMANFVFASLVLAMSTLPLHAQTRNLHTIGVVAPERPDTVRVLREL